MNWQKLQISNIFNALIYMRFWLMPISNTFVSTFILQLESQKNVVFEPTTVSVTATPVDTISIQNKKPTDAISRNVFVADTVISTCVSELFKMKMRNSCIICNRRNNEIWEQGQGQVQCKSSPKQCVIAARCGQW